MAAVCILVGGAAEYARAAHETVCSLLDYTDFQVFVAHSIPMGTLLPRSRRVHGLPLPPPDGEHRALRFLKKFEALEAVLARSDEPFIIMLDADAVLTASMTNTDLDTALGDHGMAMVEQTGIVRSTMARPDFLEHYQHHSLAYIAPEAAPPALTEFRFFNSGAVIARRAEMAQLVAWARQRIDAADRDHQVGEHMIADQDYFQVWCNNLHPGHCAELPWNWNHCELWDDDFPRPGVRIAHFSNFCNGPAEDTAGRMATLRRAGLKGWPKARAWLRERLT